MRLLIAVLLLVLLPFALAQGGGQGDIGNDASAGMNAEDIIGNSAGMPPDFDLDNAPMDSDEDLIAGDRRGVASDIRPISAPAGQSDIQAVQSMRQEMGQKMVKADEEIALMPENRRDMARSQNMVRVAVHTLLELENFSGSMGRQISEVAREFNNSAAVQARSEERIVERSRVARFFAGGDFKAAEDIEGETTRNMERLEELQRMQDMCDCDIEVKQMMQEQIRNLQSEQSRLSEVAMNERAKKGILGWIWK